ncbi:MAG TPA: bifunctional diaminohydroxyphosphoribosylaminopyrimidine deaminase/5-amino-6-(5-phosphoribosylamino)uracil reductase RibD [Microvirga sp.]
MRLALALGERNLGLTWPNPAVGAVVVAEGAHGPMIVGQGATQAGGRPHAERVALDMAGDAARGATLYVTLEPCSARSRQDHGPSCTDLVLQSGIRRLVIGAPDPSPFAHGAGFPRLEAAGVTVVQGVLAEDACRAHRGHVLRVTEGRPLLTLKFARTADGFAARRNGPRLMISGEASNARTHLLRARHDVIMVGVGTILADDPVLTVRIAGLEHRSPIRVVLDSDLRTPISSRLVSGARSVPVWIVAGEHAPLEPEAALKAAGVEVMRVAETGGRVDVTEALRLLASRGVTRIFSEGGPALGEALVEADLIDTLALATSRTALGEEGVPALGPSLAAALATRFTPLSREDLGTDVLEIFERAR